MTGAEIFASIAFVCVAAVAIAHAFNDKDKRK